MTILKRKEYNSKEA